jgi:hypothetical protein
LPQGGRIRSPFSPAGHGDDAVEFALTRRYGRAHRRKFRAGAVDAVAVDARINFPVFAPERRAHRMVDVVFSVHRGDYILRYSGISSSRPFLRLSSYSAILSGLLVVNVLYHIRAADVV